MHRLRVDSERLKIGERLAAGDHPRGANAVQLEAQQRAPDGAPRTYAIVIIIPERGA
jgi:hypothetical protein